MESSGSGRSAAIEAVLLSPASWGAIIPIPSSTPELTVPRLFSLLWTGTLVLGGLLVLSACTSSRPPEDRRAVQAQALGTWQYQVTGSPLLDRGTIEIKRDGDRLYAMLRDTRRGPQRARVRVREGRMELRLDQVVVSGRLEDNRFRATVEWATWDIRSGRSVSPSSRSARRARGTLVAQRQHARGRDVSTGERCRPLLRESSYVCSPLAP